MWKHVLLGAGLYATASCSPYDSQVAEMSDPDSAWGKAWIACDQAKTYQEAFGTPDNKGPCWGSVQAVSSSANVEVYQMTTIQNRPAVVAYSNGRLTSVTVGQ